jgi:hypothetical protein
MRIRFFAAQAAAFPAGPGSAAAAGADLEIAEHEGRLGIAMPVPAN